MTDVPAKVEFTNSEADCTCFANFLFAQAILTLLICRLSGSGLYILDNIIKLIFKNQEEHFF